MQYIQLIRHNYFSKIFFSETFHVISNSLKILLPEVYKTYQQNSVVFPFLWLEMKSLRDVDFPSDMDNLTVGPDSNILPASDDMMGLPPTKA